MGALSTGGHHPRNIPTPWLIPRTEGGTKEDLAFRGDIPNEALRKKKGELKWNENVFLKGYFFSKHPRDVLASLQKSRPRSIEIFRAPVQQVFGTNLDCQRYTRVVCTRVCFERPSTARKHIWPQIQGRTINFV